MDIKVGMAYKTTNYYNGVTARECDVRIPEKVSENYVTYSFYIMDEKYGEIRMRRTTVSRARFEETCIPFEEWLEEKRKRAIAQTKRDQKEKI